MPTPAGIARLAALAAILIAAVCACAAAQNSSSPQTAAKSQPPPPAQRIDINHASTAELLKIPGMTPSWAGRIVRFRPYRTKRDLLEHGVLPADVYDRIKDYVVAHRGEQ